METKEKALDSLMDAAGLYDGSSTDYSQGLEVGLTKGFYEGISYATQWHRWGLFQVPGHIDVILVKGEDENGVPVKNGEDLLVRVWYRKDGIFSVGDGDIANPLYWRPLEV